MKKIYITIATALLLAGCAIDNYDEPGATLSGRILYNGQVVGVRSAGTQLELWQDGYPLRSKITVYIAW
ncbi:MAG: DUF3823 domain-containing protein, partial [Odoribacteraceae bacterium]|nr:DUF3823 domain-containing protein [Odoribacteraceae bacterium]